MTWKNRAYFFVIKLQEEIQGKTMKIRRKKIRKKIRQIFWEILPKFEKKNRRKSGITFDSNPFESICKCHLNRSEVLH